jgi:hypothetical protein
MLFAAVRESGNGTSRHFHATGQFGRFRAEADIRPSQMSTRGLVIWNVMGPTIEMPLDVGWRR